MSAGAGGNPPGADIPKAAKPPVLANAGTSLKIFQDQMFVIQQFLNRLRHG